MDAEMLALTEEALSYLTPEDEELFREHFEMSQRACEALFNNPIRTASMWRNTTSTLVTSLKSMRLWSFSTTTSLNAYTISYFYG
jgi:hypothetical protein